VLSNKGNYLTSLQRASGTCKTITILLEVFPIILQILLRIWRRQPYTHILWREGQ